VDPDYRRLGLADGLMHGLEEISEKTHNGFFVDLFVRVSNTVAINMYKKFGYSIYRQVVGYYAGPHPEDAYDMRKALPRDKDRLSVVPLGAPLSPLPPSLRPASLTDVWSVALAPDPLKVLPTELD